MKKLTIRKYLANYPELHKIDIKIPIGYSIEQAEYEGKITLKEGTELTKSLLGKV